MWFANFNRDSFNVCQQQRTATQKPDKRAGFLTRHLWVTPYRPDERFPAGAYPNQNPGGDGLPRWTAADRGIDNTDLVVWYTFGHHHIPRLEDWPVMPVSCIGFSLRPDGFFEGNPAMDLPPSPAKTSCCHGSN